MAIVYRDIEIGESVSHREDMAPFSFTGKVVAIDESSGNSYGVEWEDEPDIGRQWYNRADLVARDDDDSAADDRDYSKVCVHGFPGGEHIREDHCEV